MIMVALPTERCVIKLATYGRLEMGEVPREAFIEKATPKDMIIRPIVKKIYRFINSDNDFSVILLTLLPLLFYDDALKSIL